MIQFRLLQWDRNLIGLIPLRFKGKSHEYL
jgi:hypothetical protein